ncbi:hypothetical protein MUK42_20325 [Musa troglodytarum]|nr:hypothetical protein MUK42_20325 [Musa troglodytarum]
MHLRNVSALRDLDLSGNAIRGSIPGGFWSSPALLHVNLADTTLGGALRFDSGPQAAPLRSLGKSVHQHGRPRRPAPPGSPRLVG